MSNPRERENKCNNELKGNPTQIDNYTLEESRKIREQTDESFNLIWLNIRKLWFFEDL